MTQLVFIVFVAGEIVFEMNKCHTFLAYGCKATILYVVLSE